MAHRRVKDISYDDDFDGDEDYDDEYEQDTTATLTAEDEEQMRAGSIAVRAELGDATSAIDEKEIRDALWYYYYDIEKSVDYLKRQHALVESKGPTKKSKQKPLSKFDQAAAAAKDRTNAGVQWSSRSIASSVWRPQFNNYLTASAFFADTPFLAVPPERLGRLFRTTEPPKVRTGLLGGSSTGGGGKQSKLAALAANRKRAAEEKKKASSASGPSTGAAAGNESEVTAQLGSIALLDKLGRKKGRAGPGDQSESVTSPNDDGSKSLPERPKKRTYPGRSKKPEEELVPAPSLVEENEEEVSAEPPPWSIDPDELRASPSPFAMGLFSGETVETTIESGSTDKAVPTHSRRRLFSMSYPSVAEEESTNRKGKKSANSNPFAGPSPDDVVTQAQAKGAKTNKNATKKTASNTNNDQKAEVSAVADDVASLKVEDSVAPSPKVKSKNLDVVAEFEKANLKNAANFVVIGHVDHGKSTLMGRLLHDLSLIPSRAFRKLQTSSQQAGKASFSFAWLLDTTESERSRGVTVDIASTTFSTAKTNFTILDAPGHKDFVPNMIAGTSQADFAVLVVDAGTDAFEKGMEGGGQTKEHALLARALGINRVIVAVNKMDSSNPVWSQERFNAVSQQMAAFMTSAGFIVKNTAFVPCAGLTGQNIVNRLPAETEDGKPAPWSWYDGPTLLEQLDTTGADAAATAKQRAAPLRLTIADVFRASVTAPVSISGRIDAGNMQIGDVVLAMPAGEPATIRGIDVEGASSADDADDAASNARDWAVAGQIVTAHLADIDPMHLRPGDVLCARAAPVRNARALGVRILAFDFVVPGAVDCLRGRLQAEARVAALVAVVGGKGVGAGGAEKKAKKPRVVKPGEVATVRVELLRPLPLEAGARIVLRAEGTTVAAGLVEDVEAA